MKMATLMAAAFAALASFGAGITVTPVKQANVVTGVNLTFSDLGASTYRLFVAYGEKDGGSISHRDWEKFAYVTDVTAATDGYAYSTMPYGWGTRYHAMRFFLIDAAAAKPFDKQVEYLQGDGATCAITDFTPSGVSAIEADFEGTADNSTGSGLLCARNAGGGSPFDLFTEQYWLRFDYFGYDPGGVKLARVGYLGGRHVVRVDRCGIFFDGQLASKVSTAMTSSDAGSKLVVLAAHSGLNIASYGKHKVYGVRGWAKANVPSSLALDLVPCVKDGVACFYDRVSKKCLGNSGTGKFIVGPEVPYFDSSTAAVSSPIADFAKIAVSATLAANGANVSFPALPAACQLGLAYGRQDGGSDLTAWEKTQLLDTLSAGATSYALSALPEGWGDRYHYMRFFLLDNSAVPFDKQVSYIQGTGANYMDTDFTPCGRSSIVADFDIAGGSHQSICGSSAGGYVNPYQILFYADMRLRWDYYKCDTQNLEMHTATPSGRHVVRTEEGTMYLDDTVVFTQVPTNVNAGSAMKLFVQHTGGTSLRSFGTHKLFSFKAWHNRTYIDNLRYSLLPELDLVPCVKNDKAYLFNRATGTCLENKGTGDFLYGEEVPCFDAAQLGQSASLFAVTGRSIAAKRRLENHAVSKIDLTFGVAQSPYKLYAAFDAEDKGEVFSDWAARQFVKTVDPGEAALAFTDFPAEWGTTYKFVRFFLVDDSATATPYDSRIEYIKNSTYDTPNFAKGQYILTDFTPSGRSAVELDYNNPTYTQSTAFCARHADGGNSFSLWIRGSFRFDYYSSFCLYAPTDQSNDPNNLGRHVVRCDSTGLTRDGERLITIQNPVSTVSDHPMTIFAYNNMPTIRPQSYLSLYSFKAWQDPSVSDKPALDLIPVMKNKEPCLYNKVDGTFLYNLGTGAFTAGPVLPNELKTASASAAITSELSGMVILFR